MNSVCKIVIPFLEKIFAVDIQNSFPIVHVYLTTQVIHSSTVEEGPPGRGSVMASPNQALPGSGSGSGKDEDNSSSLSRTTSLSSMPKLMSKPPETRKVWSRESNAALHDCASFFKFFLFVSWLHMPYCRSSVISVVGLCSFCVFLVIPTTWFLLSVHVPLSDFFFLLVHANTAT